MARGVGIAALLNIGAAIVGAATMVVAIGFVILLGIGVIQLAWILPFYFRFRKKGEIETAKGLLIGAAITFLLNAGCWGAFMVTMAHTTFH